MTELVPPDVRLHRSWAEAVAEFEVAGSTQHGYGLWDFQPLDTTEAGCRKAVDFLLAQADPATELPDGLVHCTYFWITEDDTFVGYLAMRHSLTPWLLEEGGHIGYSIRPSRRNEGHASRALALAVRRAREQLGIDRVLVTCDDDNEASRRTIERCGGVFEDERQGKLRYWIDTAEDAPEMK
ncbi:GNAT family N-acetyltransferase [Nocardioides hankookensis]|uniref:GNAT family N-acetyltransferase n=1 Tax=Nocardioides hankookensis TaxID=443157 RepID=A0ABW1LK71_9ACTN